MESLNVTETFCPLCGAVFDIEDRHYCEYKDEYEAIFAQVCEGFMKYEIYPSIPEVNEYVQTYYADDYNDEDLETDKFVVFCSSKGIADPFSLDKEKFYALMDEYDNMVDGADSTEPTPSKASCKFADGCKNPQCTFWHATTPAAHLCRDGLKCKKQAECKYVHAVTACKFALGCKNPSCEYGHPDGFVRPTSSAPPPKKSITCKFGQHCTKRATCTFSHTN